MTGVKGRSGRKPDPYGNYSRHGKKTFYVKQHLMDGKWQDDHDFQWFVKKHGQNWQRELRIFMRQEVKAWKKLWWSCECEKVPTNLFSGLNHPRVDRCGKCLEYKNEIARRIYE